MAAPFGADRPWPNVIYLLRHGETVWSLPVDSRAAATIAISHRFTSRLLRGVYLGLSRRQTLELPVSQKGFLLSDGRLHLIE
jgi:hypothetical protein